MSLAPTLAMALAQAAEGEGSFTHIVDARAPREVVSYGQLYLRARRVAAALQGMGLRKGDRAALVLPSSLDFMDVVYGCLLAGVIAVPLYPPLNLSRIGSWSKGCVATLRRSGCRLLVTDGQVRPMLGTLLSGAPELEAVTTLPGLLRGVPEGASPRPVDLRSDDVAMLKFTSGSTAQPKGVTLTHANLAANVEGIGVALGITPGDESVVVSWLPLYHDMGLIGFVFAPVWLRLRGVRVMSPLLFLKRPSTWLVELSDSRARATFAPNFAYGLACKRVRDSQIEGIDLSAVEVAGCGAEPIQHRTLAAFADRFAAHGFRRRALLPCYGMAEHCLGVSFIGLEEEFRADRVDPQALAEGAAEPSADEQALSVVSCGRPLPGHEIRIVGEDGDPLPEGSVGRIELSGPSVMQGYWNDPERTAAVLHDGWLVTGDVGYLRGGELHVCGRVKELILLNGRNYYPQDLEAVAWTIEGVRKGNVVAFGVVDSSRDREQVVLAAEVREGTDEERVVREITTAVLDALSLRLDEVVLLPPGSIPKTSSGKLQRTRVAALHAEGSLGRPEGSRLQLAKHLAASRWGFLKAELGLRGR